MRYRLRTLLIAFLLGPPTIAAVLLYPALPAVLLGAAFYVGFWFVLGLGVGAVVIGLRRLIAGILG